MSSCSTDDASASDREALIHEFRIKVIMDLRTKYDEPTSSIRPRLSLYMKDQL